MQFGLPFGAGPPSGEAGNAPIAIPPAPGARTADVRFVRHARARRYVLRVRPDGSVWVTIPRRGSKRQALVFVEAHRAWLDKHIRLVAAAVDIGGWRAGSEIWWRGERVTLDVASSDQGRFVVAGPDAIRLSDGTAGDLRMVLEPWLRGLAAADLPPRLTEMAAAFDLRVSRVSIRNQRARWGSCGPDGHICLNWRLVQMPAFVRDYVLVHELMHLRRPDHSPTFWREVTAACPRQLEARRWLRTHGRLLI